MSVDTNQMWVDFICYMGDSPDTGRSFLKCSAERDGFFSREITYAHFKLLGNTPESEIITKLAIGFART